MLLYLFALFYFVFEDTFQVLAPGGLYSEGRFNGGFFCVTSLRGLNLEGLINGGAQFSEFYGLLLEKKAINPSVH